MGVKRRRAEIPVAATQAVVGDVSRAASRGQALRVRPYGPSAKRGGRFSTNARVPSAMSPLVRRRSQAAS